MVVVPRILAAFLDFLVAALGERAAGHPPVADVAVGDRDELYRVAAGRPHGGDAAGLQLAIVGVGAEGDDSQRAAGGRCIAVFGFVLLLVLLCCGRAGDEQECNDQRRNANQPSAKTHGTPPLASEFKTSANRSNDAYIVAIGEAQSNATEPCRCSTADDGIGNSPHPTLSRRERRLHGGPLDVDPRMQAAADFAIGGVVGGETGDHAGKRDVFALVASDEIALGACDNRGLLVALRARRRRMPEQPTGRRGQRGAIVCCRRNRASPARRTARFARWATPIRLGAVT